MLMPSMRYFYPRSPCGERLTVSTLKILAILFLSTLSLRRATTTSAGRSAFRRHFYPRSPCGERRVGPRWYSGVCNFYPRSPCGERPQGHNPGSNKIDFYPRSPCGERLWAAKGRNGQKYFYPRSPCGERLVDLQTLQQYRFVFLSTLSLRRATFRSRFLFNLLFYFYPRSPCGERPFKGV